MMYVEFMKNFSLADTSERAVIISAYWAQKTFDSSFLDSTSRSWKILVSDSSALMAVRLISASWAQKRLIPTF